MSFIISLLLVVVLFIAWRFLLFFRNPNRTIEQNPDHVLAPADGFIVYIKEVSINAKTPIFSIKGKHVIKLNDLMILNENTQINKAGILIGIFMSPFDVHYNRAPISGHIKKIGYEFPENSFGIMKNLSMFNTLSNLVFDEKPYIHDSEYVITNERASYIISNDELSIYVTQIADQWVNQIVTLKDNQALEQGEVFGMIRMGSQVDIFVPGVSLNQVLVSERKHVVAGKSILINFNQVSSESFLDN